jgi:predicted amidohydrolase YtcJ
LHILPVGQPPFLYNIGDSFRTNLGSKRTRWIYPFKTWLNKGLKPSGSSDCPVVLGAPLLGIWAAVNRKTEAGETLVSEECVTPQEAIQMYTIHSAYTSYDEHTKGSLEPGKHADIVILTDDPTTIPPDQIKNITVLATIIAGHIAYGTL